MACHFPSPKTKPAIQKLKSYADRKEPIPWVRVYQIPSYVDFSHKAHLGAGFKMRECHGSVEMRDALWKETDISMGVCISCHKQTRPASRARTATRIGNSTKPESGKKTPDHAFTAQKVPAQTGTAENVTTCRRGSVPLEGCCGRMVNPYGSHHARILTPIEVLLVDDSAADVR